VSHHGIQSCKFRALGGPCEILVVANPDEAAPFFAAARQELARFEATYSRYLPDSLISRINASAGSQWTDIDPETEFLFGVADWLFEKSQGRFDLTSGIFRRAWKFGSAAQSQSTQGPSATSAAIVSLPSPEELAALAAHVGWNRIERRAGQIRLPDPQMEIDLGGIGKEYAADRVARLLKGQNALVNLGGDLVALGRKPDASPWQAGIQHPRKENTILASLAVTDKALATSGDYQRVVEINGQRYSHVLNATTGWPVAYWQSVSVSAANCLQAGCLTSLAMVLEQDGLKVLQDSGQAFLAVDPLGKVVQGSSSNA